jgi:hypothetical protein
MTLVVRIVRGIRSEYGTWLHEGREVRAAGSCYAPNGDPFARQGAATARRGT